MGEIALMLGVTIVTFYILAIVLGLVLSFFLLRALWRMGNKKRSGAGGGMFDDILDGIIEIGDFD